MTKPLPKWIMYIYSVLWNKFGDKEFGHNDAFKTLKKDKMLSIALSKLRQSAWLEIKLDLNDARKRIYKLKSPDKAIKEMEKE